jgi:hypothetical protein
MNANLIDKEIKMNPTNVFAQKHTQALELLGYRYVLLNQKGEVCQATIDKYLIERPDGSFTGTLDHIKEAPQKPVKRARKRRNSIRYQAQTGYIDELRRMTSTPGACTALTPPLNVTAQAMQHAVHSAALRVFGKGNFETTVVSGQVMVFYKGPAQEQTAESAQGKLV